MEDFLANVSRELRTPIASTLRGRKAIDTKTLFITYAGLTREELAAIEEQVKKRRAFRILSAKRRRRQFQLTAVPAHLGCFL